MRKIATSLVAILATVGVGTAVAGQARVEADGTITAPPGDVRVHPDGLGLTLGDVDVELAWIEPVPTDHADMKLRIAVEGLVAYTAAFRYVRCRPVTENSVLWGAKRATCELYPAYHEDYIDIGVWLIRRGLALPTKDAPPGYKAWVVDAIEYGYGFWTATPD